MRARRTAASLFAASLLLGGGGLAACSDDTQDAAEDAANSAADDARDAAGEAGETVDAANARVLAESIRAGLKVNDTADEEGIRSVAAIEEVVDTIPNDPDVSGIEDEDGDGLDDDGRVQVTVDEQQACVILPEEGEDTSIEDGAC